MVVHKETDLATVIVRGEFWGITILKIQPLNEAVIITAKRCSIKTDTGPVEQTREPIN